LLEVGGLGERAPGALHSLLDEGRALVLDAGDPEQIELTDLIRSGRSLVVSRMWWSSLVDRIRDALSSYHEAFPLRPGMPREALRSRLELDPRIFDAVVAQAEHEDVLVDEGASVRLSAHAVELTPRQQQRVSGLLDRFRADPYAPPSVKEAVEMVGEDVYRVLISRDDLVQVSPDVVFLPETYQTMVSRIRARIERGGSVTLAEVRDMFDSSRKYAQAILEYLDEKGVTKRLGDKRVLR